MPWDLPDILGNLARSPERLQQGVVYESGGWSGTALANDISYWDWEFLDDGFLYVIDSIDVYFYCVGPINTWVEWHPDVGVSTTYDISEQISEFSAHHYVGRSKVFACGYPGMVRVNISNTNSVDRFAACVFNWYRYALP